MNSVRYYGLSYNNPQRKQRLQEQFTKENLHIDIYDGVPLTDSRITCVAPGEKCNRRAWSCMWGHLDMIRQFLDTTADFGIFCEDDIHIRRGIKEIIPETIAKYKRQKLEILMLGYLFPFKPVELSFYHEPEFYNQKLDIIDENLIYFTYIDRLWGAQMYMLDRKTVSKFLNKYTLEYAHKTINDPNLTPFAADWTITKDGNRAAVYPMLGVEEKPTDPSDYGQYNYHMKCNVTHFDELKYI